MGNSSSSQNQGHPRTYSASNRNGGMYSPSTSSNTLSTLSNAKGSRGPDPTKSIKIVILRDQGTQTNDSNQEYSSNTAPTTGGWNLNRVFLVIGTTYFLMCFFLIVSPFAQSIPLYLNLIRFPFGDLTNLPRFGLFNARNIQITTRDGYSLKGYHLLPSHLRHWRETSNNSLEYHSKVDFDELLNRADRIIIYFHGNAATRAAPIRLKSIKQMSYALNSHVVTFDYRGFGDSEGWPSEEGTYLDGLAAVQWVMQRIGCVSEDTFPPMYTSPYRGWAEDDNLEGSFVQPPSSILSYLQSWIPFAGYQHVSVGKGSVSVKSRVENLQNHYQNEFGKYKNKNQSEISQGASSDMGRCDIQRRPKIYLYGQSLGSGIITEVAMRLNAYRPGTIEGVIYDAPFASALQAALTHPIGAPLRLFPIVTKLLMKYMHAGYENAEKITHVKAPVLLLHGALDGQVTPDNSERLFHQLLATSNQSAYSVDNLYGRFQAVNFTELSMNLHLRSINDTTRTCNQIQIREGNDHCSAEHVYMAEYVSFPHAGHNDVHDAPTYVETMVHFFRVVESQ